MIDNLTVSVTGACNSRCTMCHQWQGTASEDLCPEEYESLFGKPEFADVEYLNITGGEPFLRKDINDVIEAIVAKMKKLKIFFVSTNGTLPNTTVRFIEDFLRRHEEVNPHVTVSVDGDRQTNRIVRGIDNYDSGLRTIELCRAISNRVSTMVSATLTPINCSTETLSHLREVADRLGSEFSFRMGASNEFYRNARIDFTCSQEQIREVIDFSRRFCTDNPFLLAQAAFLETGQMPIMGTRENLKCTAGTTFAFIDSSGNIFPCINSSRKIGYKIQGISKPQIADLGTQEKCVCCTECTFYPMLYHKD